MHVPIPDNMELVEERGDLILRRTWFGHHVWFLVLFAVFWNSFLIFWYFQAFTQADAPLMMKLFPIGHVVVGLGLIYFIVATFLNKTDIKITPLSLKVRSYPVKWLGNRSVNVDDIQQLYVEEKISRNKNGHHVRYVVNVLTKSNKRLKLVGGLQDKAQAIFIEKKIEELLALPDEAVAGEA